jgi:hypothetical protein
VIRPDNDKKSLLYFAMGIVAACFIYFFCITFLPVPAGGQRYADLILGFLLGTACAAVINFYWGSSKGSQDKNEALKG